VLVQVIAQLAIFLEFAAEDVLELEAAVKQQEDLAFRLLQLPAAERTELIRLLHHVADEWPNDTERAYLHSLPEVVGIA
jgi:hypothetical protein